MSVRVVLLILVCISIPVYDATAQRQSTSELLSLYLKERAFELAARDVMRRGGRVRPMPLARLRPRNDRIGQWMKVLYPESEPRIDTTSFIVESLQPIKRIRRPVHEALFTRTAWAFAGSQSRSPLDTLQTRDIRSRMQAHFGSPSRLVIDMDSVEALPAAEVIQFEYWFVVNDSIPVMVVDVNGPWDRGIIVAAPAALRSEIRSLKRALLDPVLRSSKRDPWADYYYNAVQRIWYITGYDGAMFFDKRIGRPDAGLGPPSILPFLENQ
ncbi:MAG: hypothetical protein COV99_01660 [Bacteroidetes bacterium CG12_big_fil_rev_8_21_14_0_65_60_17]|nr:MAG: hypothetical protein COV99_01660 [Bacteroidetes bacterium CG12_big_fil_rev_8_21_14_0_65_60_17]